VIVDLSDTDRYVRRIKFQKSALHYPTMIWCCCSGWFCSNIQMNFISPKTRMTELSDGEDAFILFWFI